MAGREAQVGRTKIPFKIFFDSLDPPGPKERRQLEKRLDRVENMTSEVKTAGLNLRQVPRLPKSLAVRPEFVYRIDPVPGDFSDRRLPPRVLRPPATRLLTSRGLALKLYLIALFEAQTRTRGSAPDNRRPLLHPGQSEISWVDLIATPANPTKRGHTAASRSDNKLRQVHEALRHLSGVTVQLVRLPHAGEALGTYDDFELLAEKGAARPEDADGGGQNDRYRVPLLTEPVLHMPAGLFTNGWIHVLDDAELALLLMLAHLRSVHGDKQLYETGDRRLRHYCLGRDAYLTHRRLERFGLIDVTRAPTRHSDGAVRNYAAGEPALLHKFRLLDAGFAEPAVDIICSALRGRLGLQEHRLRVAES